MSDSLLSVGLDVGTGTTQLIVSRLEIRNRASDFSVPELSISKREILYKSPVYLTPLLGENRVDGEKIREIVVKEYEKAEISREAVDTGAVIITGETSRKENARAVVEALSEFAGDFVVATAGPELESVLAAKGAGAAEYSRETGKTVLHMDIGGGTANLARIEEGIITETGCLNIGGRLVKYDGEKKISYVSPVLADLWNGRPGEKMTRQRGEVLCNLLSRVLETAAGLREITPVWQALCTAEARPMTPKRADVLSFSGGVAQCIQSKPAWDAYGDLGPLLAEAIRDSRLFRQPCRVGENAIRATVIGAGCHSARLSGSTVFYRNVSFPLKNLPVIRAAGAEEIARRLAMQDGPAVLALDGKEAQSYREIRLLAEEIRRGFQNRPVYVAARQDLAKALGQAIFLGLPPDRPCLCLDGLRLEEGSFLDVGAPVGPALPAVIRTLILNS